MSNIRELTGKKQEEYINKHFNNEIIKVEYEKKIGIQNLVNDYDYRTNTQDFSHFGYREIAEAGRLLTAYVDKPDILGDGVAVEFNPSSGSVFLIDEDFEVAMMNGDDLEIWYNCPKCGEEGFLDEIKEYGNDCCIEYLEEIGLNGPIF